LKTKFLVDTSVFINFFRGEDDTELDLLIREDRVVVSQIVLLEIIKGVTKVEAKKVLNLLEGLEVFEDFPPAVACQELLAKAKHLGLQGGIPDLLILADCYVNQIKLYSLDIKLIRLAKALKIPVRTK
jgi:predicted nucleic acid-binding protein